MQKVIAHCRKCYESFVLDEEYREMQKHYKNSGLLCSFCDEYTAEIEESS